MSHNGLSTHATVYINILCNVYIWPCSWSMPQFLLIHDVWWWWCFKINCSEEENLCGTTEEKINTPSDGKLFSCRTTTPEWQMQIKVWPCWVFLYKTVFIFSIMHSQSCITQACCYLKLKTAISWNRNSELLPEHLSIMQSSHIPNALRYRILFFHLWWTPRFKSKHHDAVQLSRFPSPPLIL